MPKIVNFRSASPLFGVQDCPNLEMALALDETGARIPDGVLCAVRFVLADEFRLCMASIPPMIESDGGLYLVGDSPCEITIAEKQRVLAKSVELYFEELRRPVYTYAFSICRSPERAEEITQDAFLRLHASLRSGETICSVRSWVFRVAHNLAINEAKKRRFELPCRMDSGDMTMRSDALPDPEQQLLRAERSSQFRKGMETLTENQRYCMQLRAEGLQAKQIAEILRISRGGVVDTLQRAMKRLRKALV